MKKKFSLGWRVVVILALVASLGMVFAASTGANNVVPPPDTGTIIIEKVTFPPGDPETFDINFKVQDGDWAKVGTIGDGEQIVIPDVPRGAHQLSEIVPPGWYLNISFDDDDSQQMTSNNALVKLDPCEVVTATFTNIREQPIVNIIECPDYDVPYSTTFVIKAEITNTSDWPMGSDRFPRGVHAMIHCNGEVELEDDHPIWLGKLDPGETNTVAWRFHCTGPGDVDIWVDTNWGGYDECFAHQIVEPGLAVTVVCPCEICTNCPWDQGTVDARIQNTGDIDITDIQVILSKDGASTGTATITGSTSRFITLLPAMQSILISSLPAGPWPFTCTGEGSVIWNVSAQGINSSTGDPVPPSAATGTCTTEQEEVTVDVPCVLGLSTEVNPDYPTVPGAEKYLPACDEDCKFMPPNTGFNDTGQPMAYDIVSYDLANTNTQKFMVTAAALNCTDQLKDLTICIVPPGTAAVDTSEPVHVQVVGTGLEYWLPGGPTCVTVDNVCGCCEVLVTWILECTGETTGKYDPIEIHVTEINPSNGSWNNLPCNPAAIIQVPKAHLESTLEAFVTDCTGCPTRVDTVAVSQDFDARLCIENTGVADAYDVMVDMTVLGTASCAGSVDDFYIGTIEGGKAVCFWLSEIMGSTCHCDEEGQVDVRVDWLRGYDENTCELIPSANIDAVCPLLIKQCDIEVEIINPEYCEEICTGDKFAVKAKFTNCGLCDFEDVQFLLNWDGDGDVRIAPMFSQVVTLDDLVEEWDVIHDPLGECITYEVTWMVKCTKPGDVTFHVCVMSDPEWDEGEEPPHMGNVPHFQIRDITDPPATVHQRPRAEITVEIISPENLDTFVATGQEFTVTAAIANKTDYGCPMAPGGMQQYPVTITDLGLMLHPESGATVLDSPDVPFVISGGEIETVTWTLECNESGLQIVDAYVVAETYDCCPPFEACSFPILVWQYPTSHLEVEILTVMPGTTINACEDFQVYYTVTNTGEADATETEAILSVIPEGTARPAEGYDQGYTVDIGTLAGHGQEGTYEGVWNLHCKEACESTINITAAGYDEYGWHKKQECQSTGNFIIEDGCAIFGQTGYTGLEGAPTGAMAAVFVGEASGLIGPFNLNVPVSFNGEDMGNMVAMGAVLPDMDYVSFNNHVESLLDICPDCPSLLELLEWNNLQGVNKDVMIFVGQLVMDSPMDEVPYGCYCASAGLLQVINGHFSGAGVSLTFWEGLDVMAFLDGEYCSTMAQEALREIPEKFIEDDSVTVKQLPSAGVDLGVIKTVDNTNPKMGEDVVYTITVTNYGPGQATGVEVTDTLWDTIVSYVSDVATQGTYDDTSGVWTIGNMTVGASATLVIIAHVGAEVEFVNTATVTCDQPDGNPANDTDRAVINPSLAILLEEGWNFVSWPLIPDNPTTEVVLDDLVPLLTNLESAWGNFDPVAGTWDSYDPESGTNTLTEMWDGVGFWIEMLTPGQSILIEGQEQPDPPATPRVYPVVGGAGGYWNVIGFKSTTAKSPDDYLEGIADQYTIIYGFDEGAYFVVGTPAHLNLEPGLAYWIAVLESGNIFP